MLATEKKLKKKPAHVFTITTSGRTLDRIVNSILLHIIKGNAQQTVLTINIML